jgi:DNA-binding NarL/FixJ family response regulator
VGTADTVEACRAGISATAPDVAVLDLFFETGPCLDLVREISGPPSSTHVLVLSGAGDRAHAARMVFAAGARGFIGKAEPSDSLMSAIV